MWFGLEQVHRKARTGVKRGNCDISGIPLRLEYVYVKKKILELDWQIGKYFKSEYRYLEIFHYDIIIKVCS